MKYPTEEQVEKAVAREDRFKLGFWLRFLPSPGDNYLNGNDGFDNVAFHTILREEKAILDGIHNAFHELGGWTTELSKRIEHEPPVE